MDEIYRRHRTEYDRLVAAEDSDCRLPAFLADRFDWRAKTVLEGGIGTGRVTALFIESVRRVIGFDREAHMLEAARLRLAAHADKLELRVADNRALPRLPEPADLFIEGWSWGHTILEDPDPVEPVADALFASLRPCLVPAAPVVLIETLGTNARTPAAPHPRLAEFYRLLQFRYGLRQTVLSTDYRFADAAEAADVLGFFFGPAMKRAVLAAGSSTVPECTGIGTPPPAFPLSHSYSRQVARNPTRPGHLARPPPGTPQLTASAPADAAIWPRLQPRTVRLHPSRPLHDIRIHNSAAPPSAPTS
jgi:SAM-dependent methyltransferase